jgi:selenocysteine lyase/cysteine desulfurase
VRCTGASGTRSTIARALAARLIGADAKEIAIIKNTSEGLSFVAQGLRWHERDNVITTALEFPANWTPWKRLEGAVSSAASRRYRPWSTSSR